MTKQELIETIEVEGFGYAVTEYVNPDSIEDPELRELARRAKEAMLALANHLDI